MIYGMRWECLKSRSNTLHVKFVPFSRTEDLQKLRFNSSEEFENDERILERVDTVLEMSYGGSSGTETVREQ